ncbi:ubiquitin fusion degradation protein 1 [Trichomonascus vanleenenianus]|uniref:polyubiquitin-binding protein UFD1 n=1 Tax=Trichomonascus vanleenenianus TaxID=2268995 RepID=UPI003ECAEFF9
MFSSFGAPFMAGAQPQKFQQFFRCYPSAMLPGKERTNLNYGGKIIMPPSALNKLTMLHITYPMLFELTSEETGLKTYAGVLEFIAEEGRVYMPQWMMDTLALQPGSLIQVKSTDLPSGQFVKIQAQSVDFLDITDQKAVLENALRNFSALTVGDLFEINYNDKVYGIKVLEVKPETSTESICVVETDLEVDFAPPIGYVEPTPSKPPSSAASSIAPSRTAGTPVGTMANSIGYAKLAATSKAKESSAFGGGGQKLSGKSKSKTDEAPAAPTLSEMTELPAVDAPALNLPFGQLFFGFPLVPIQHKEDEEQREKNENTSADIHFQGSGKTLRQSKKRKDEEID